MLHETFSCSSYQKDKGTKPGDLPKSNALSEIGKQWIEKYFGFTGLRVVSWFRRLVAGLSPWQSGFEPGPIHMGFEVDRVATEHDFLLVLACFLRHYHFHQYSTRILFFTANLNRTNTQGLRTFHKANNLWAIKEINVEINFIFSLLSFLKKLKQIMKSPNCFVYVCVFPF